MAYSEGSISSFEAVEFELGENVHNKAKFADSLLSKMRCWHLAEISKLSNKSKKLSWS